MSRNIDWMNDKNDTHTHKSCLTKAHRKGEKIDRIYQIETVVLHFVIGWIRNDIAKITSFLVPYANEMIETFMFYA